MSNIEVRQDAPEFLTAKHWSAHTIILDTYIGVETFFLCTFFEHCLWSWSSTSKKQNVRTWNLGHSFKIELLMLVNNTVDDYFQLQTAKNSLNRKSSTYPVNAGLYMALRHSFWFVIILAANFGSDPRFRLQIPKIPFSLVSFWLGFARWTRPQQQQQAWRPRPQWESESLVQTWKSMEQAQGPQASKGVQVHASDCCFCWVLNIWHLPDARRPGPASKPCHCKQWSHDHPINVSTMQRPPNTFLHYQEALHRPTWAKGGFWKSCHNSSVVWCKTWKACVWTQSSSLCDSKPLSSRL